MKIAIAILAVFGVLVAIAIGFLVLRRTPTPSSPEVASPAMGLVSEVAGAYLGGLGVAR